MSLDFNFFNLMFKIDDIFTSDTAYYFSNLQFVIFFSILFNYCLIALFHLKLSGFYAINPNSQSDGYSLFHLTLFICRVSFPLCLNFLSFFKYDFKTALQEVNIFLHIIKINGGIEKIPIFQYTFPMFYPVLFTLFCLFNIFNIYNKLMNFIGVSTFGFQNEYNDEKIKEGQDIMKKSNLI